MTNTNQMRADKDQNRFILLGCVGFIILFFFILAFSLVIVLSYDRESARYPGALSLSSHNNYSGLPRQYRWDDSYLVQDKFADVYNWYSITFDLGAESQANGDCIQLDGQQTQLIIQRTVNVLICATKQGQLVYVTRITAVNH